MDTPNTPRRAARTPTFRRLDPQQRTPVENDLLTATPLELARLLCGPGILGHLRPPGNATRAHLAHAGWAMTNPFEEQAPDLHAVRQDLRNALACAVRPDGIEERPETILAQVALWLVEMQAEVEEVGALFAAAAAASHGQPRH
ncbi:MAG: hypothetical protein L6Q75_20305 [Burkholderiaceae bacterium]|nr:hypothetical protein [Burkholderiaceae bacterium]